MILVATTTWNSIDLIEEFLVHYQKLGVQKIMVMDFDSTDGTQSVLKSSRWADFVHLTPFPGVADLDSSNIMLSIAKSKFGSDSYCLFCDPDEFLVTPSMRIEEVVGPVRADRMDACVIPRFNMTAARKVAVSQQSRLTPFDALKFRVDHRVKRRVSVDMGNEVLDPPWISTAILGKVLVRLEATISICDGDHQAECKDREVDVAGDGVYLLHYPVRTWAEFENKIDMAKVDMGANTDLPDAYGWQIRRWVRLSNSGELYEEYLAQFAGERDLDSHLADGSLCVDESVRVFNSAGSRCSLRQRIANAFNRIGPKSIPTK